MLGDVRRLALVVAVAGASGSCVLVTSFDLKDDGSSSGGAASSSSGVGSTTSSTAGSSMVTGASASTGSSMGTQFVVSAELGSVDEVSVQKVIEGPNDSIWFAGRYKGDASIGGADLPPNPSGAFYVGHVNADGTGFSAVPLAVSDSTKNYDSVTIAWDGGTAIWFMTAQVLAGDTGEAKLGWFDVSNPSALNVVATCTGSGALQGAALALDVPAGTTTPDVVFAFNTNRQSTDCTFVSAPTGTACTSKVYTSPTYAYPDTLLWYARRSAGVCYEMILREESGPGSFQSAPRVAIDPSSQHVLLVGRYTGELFGPANPIQTSDPANINVADEYAAELVPNGTTLSVAQHWDLGVHDDPGAAQPHVSPTGEWIVSGTVFPGGSQSFVQDSMKPFQGASSGYLFRVKPTTSVDLWTASQARSAITEMRPYADKQLVLGNAANVVFLNGMALTAPCHTQQPGTCFSSFWSLLGPGATFLDGATYGAGSGAADPNDEPRYLFVGGFVMKDGRIALGGEVGGKDAGTMTLGGTTITSNAAGKTLFVGAIDPAQP